MLTGKEKATLLLTLLGEKASDILGRLQPSTAEQLSQLLQEPEILNQEDPKAVREILKEVHNYIEPAPKSLRVTNTDTKPEETIPIDWNQGSSTLFGSNEEKPQELIIGELRSPEKIATILSEQKPQIIAFVLSKIKPELKETITAHLSPVLIDIITELETEKTPLSDNVFKKIYNDIFLISERDLEESLAPAENNDMSSFSGFDLASPLS